MGRGEHDRWRGIGLQRLLPARGAQTPAVVGLESRKAERGLRSGEIIPAFTRELQERGGHMRTDNMPADVFGAGVAAAVAEEARQWARATLRQRAAQYVAGTT